MSDETPDAGTPAPVEPVYRRRTDVLINGMSGGISQAAQFTGAGIAFVIALGLVYFLTSLVNTLERNRQEVEAAQRESWQLFVMETRESRQQTQNAVTTFQTALVVQRQHDSEQRELTRKQFAATQVQVEQLVKVVADTQRTTAATLETVQTLVKQMQQARGDRPKQ